MPLCLFYPFHCWSCPFPASSGGFYRGFLTVLTVLTVLTKRLNPDIPSFTPFLARVLFPVWQECARSMGFTWGLGPELKRLDHPPTTRVTVGCWLFLSRTVLPQGLYPRVFNIPDRTGRKVRNSGNRQETLLFTVCARRAQDHRENTVFSAEILTFITLDTADLC